jgi:hypothetical protein
LSPIFIIECQSATLCRCLTGSTNKERTNNYFDVNINTSPLIDTCCVLLVPSCDIPILTFSLACKLNLLR